MKSPLWLALPALLLAGCGGSSSDDPAAHPAEPVGTEGAPALSVKFTGLVEGASALIVTVSYDDVADEARRIMLVIQAETADSADVALVDSVLTVPAGETSADTQLFAVSDDLDEGEETFTLSLYESDASSPADSLAFTIQDTARSGSLPSLSVQRQGWPQTGVFMAAGECGTCHTASELGDTPGVMRAPHPTTANQPDPQGEDISPYSGWKHSIMANSLTDPYFRAAVKHEAETFPELAGFIEDTCTKCHAPMGRTHAHHDGGSLTQGATCPLADGCYELETAMSEPHAREGISCTACHQITDKVMNEEVDSGNYEIVDTDNPEIFGPFQGPMGQSMENRTGYTPVFSDHMDDSRHCRSCHDLKTPTIDMATGRPSGGEFPEQMAYTEWDHSDFAVGGVEEASCQDCHMQSPGDDFLTRIAIQPNGSVNSNWPERSPYYRHEMVGANAWMLDLLGTYREELGLTEVTTEQGFRDKANATRAMLQGAASLSIDNAGLDNGTLAFDVTVANQTGHKLPTAYPSRRVWLATRVRDGSGQTVFESGHPDPVTHRLAIDAAFTTAGCLASQKPAGFDSGRCYMPHIDTVTAADQVPIYEPVLAATDGNITHVLLYADGFLKDNRIPPRGFDNAAVPDDIRPRGVSADADFNAGGNGADTVKYRLPLSASGPFTMEVTLYHQPVRPTFVDALHGDHEFIEHFHTMAADNPPTAEVIASASTTLP